MTTENQNSASIEVYEVVAQDDNGKNTLLLRQPTEPNANGCPYPVLIPYASAEIGGEGGPVKGDRVVVAYVTPTLSFVLGKLSTS